jgi:hypothetical protein
MTVVRPSADKTMPVITVRAVWRIDFPQYLNGTCQTRPRMFQVAYLFSGSILSHTNSPFREFPPIIIGGVRRISFPSVNS